MRDYDNPVNVQQYWFGDVLSLLIVICVIDRDKRMSSGVLLIVLKDVSSWLWKVLKMDGLEAAFSQEMALSDT